MFAKINAIPKKVNQYSNLQITKYHATNIQLSNSNPKWDSHTSNQIKNLIAVTSLHNNKDLTSVKEIFLSYLNTFDRALHHDCFNDVILRNEAENKVTVAFLPISTSNNIVFCGAQKFNKIYINLKGYKTFYITRLLFHKTMTVEEYNKWVKDSQKWYQDPKLRKAIFNEVQKDLDKNSYSLLKDSDLIQPNMPNIDFCTKELPLVKFKFTDLEL